MVIENFDYNKNELSGLNLFRGKSHFAHKSFLKKNKLIRINLSVMLRTLFHF